MAGQKREHQAENPITVCVRSNAHPAHVHAPCFNLRHAARERAPASRPPVDSPTTRGRFTPREKYGLAKKARPDPHIHLYPVPPPYSSLRRRTSSSGTEDGAGGVRKGEGTGALIVRRPKKLSPIEASYTFEHTAIG